MICQAFLARRMLTERITNSKHETKRYLEKASANTISQYNYTNTYSYLPDSDFIQQLTSNLDLIFPESLRIIDKRIEHC